MKFGVSPFGIWRNQTADPLGSDTSRHRSRTTPSPPTPASGSRRSGSTTSCRRSTGTSGFAVADYAKLVPWWADVVAGTKVQLYIGAGRLQDRHERRQPAAWIDPREMTDHLTFNRELPVGAGNVHFSAVQVRANRLGATDIYAAEHYSRPALVPTMSHLPSKPLLFPVITSATRTRRRGHAALAASRLTGSARSARPRRTRSTASTDDGAPRLRPRRRDAPVGHRTREPEPMWTTRPRRAAGTRTW